MADSSEVRALLLQINANTELLRSNLSQAEQAIAKFHSDTQSHLDEADKRWESFGKSIEGLEGPLERLKSLSELAVGALLGESLIEKGRQALEFAGNIQFMANQIGVSTDFLQKFNYAASQYGVSTEIADTALTRFSRTIGEAANGNREALDLFNRLGVNIYDAGGKLRSVQAVYADFANAIQKLDPPSRQVADTMQAMGREAAGLAPLVRGGAESFDTLSAAAEQLGIVLGPELIEHSEQVNHTLAAMKQILTAEMSSVIAQNAVQIESLATALIHAAGATAQFLNSHPKEAGALLGAMAGSRILGLPGAVIGGVGGAVLAGFGENAANEANNDIPFRLQQLRQAQQNFRDIRARDGTALTKETAQGSVSTPFAGAMQDYKHQQELFQRAWAAKPPAEPDLGSNAPGATNINNTKALADANAQLANLERLKVGASGAALAAINDEVGQEQRYIALLKQGIPPEQAKQLAAREGAELRKAGNAATKAANEAEEQRKKLVEEDLQFETEQLRLQKSILDGKAHTVSNDAARDALEKQIVNETADELATQIAQRRDNVLSDPKATQARKDAAKAHATTLLSLNEQDRQQKLANVDLQRAVQNQKDAADRAALDLQGQIDLLGLSDQLAITRKQRLAYELQLLELQRQQALKAQQDIIDSKDPSVTEQQRTDARTRQNQINSQYPARVAAAQRQNADPLQAYGMELKQNVGDMSDALDNIEVDGLKNVETGLVAIVDGSKSAKDAIHDLVLSMLQDFAKLEIERGFLSLLGLGSSFAAPSIDLSGTINSLDTSIAPSLAAGLSYGGARASGGPVDPSQIYLVGENGPEPFIPSGAGTILPNSAIRAPTISSADLRASAGTNVTVSIDARGASHPDDVRAAVQQGMAAAYEAAVATSADHTNDMFRTAVRMKL